jgi:S-adenosylmethionine uptake transporter
VPIAIGYRKLEPIQFKQNWRYLAGMIVASFFTWGPLYYAILHAGVGISLTVTYASYVISAFFFGRLFANERFTTDKALSAALGIAGLGLIFSPSTTSLGWVALLAALVSGLSIGGTTVFSKQISYNATQSTIALWTTSVVANFLMAFIFRETIPSAGWHAQWLYLLFFAIASVIASWMLVTGLKLIDAGAAGVLGLLEIVFGVLFGVLFFHERPDTLVILGVAIIIAAAAIPYVKDYNAKRGTLD